MQKENIGCYKKSMSCREVVTRHLRIFVSDGRINERKKIRRSRIKSGMTPLFNNNAFTLIELLVVVLIIGILAAVALPQYQKAVWKSRAANMQTYMSSVANAQHAYYLANGTQPAQLDELAVSLDGFTEGTKLGGNATTLNAYNDLFEIRVSPKGITTYFISGKYKGCGFSMNFTTNKWACSEWHHYYKGTPGGFCQQIMKAGELLADTNNVRNYVM